MRLAIAGFVHETVTFLPEETPLALFEAQALRGEALLTELAGSATVAGGFIDAAAAAGVETQCLVWSDVSPSGPVTDAAFDAFLAEVTEDLRANTGRIDGLLLHLHGAMATPTRLDPEADFLAALRAALGPEFPIALALDLHANVSLDMVTGADLVCGFHQSPHVDMNETGRRTARLLIGKLRGKIRPVMAIAKPPLVLPSIFTATALEPLALIKARAKALEEEAGLLDISVFTGFAYADVPAIGFAVVVVADGDAARAEAAVDELDAMIRAARDDLFKRELILDHETAVAQAVARAADASPPVVLLEHADRMNDSTYVLRALAHRPGPRVAVPYLWDPESVSAACAAGVGAEIDLQLGGKSSVRAGGPVPLRARVVFAGPKRFTGTGPMRKGAPVDLGDCAVLEAGSITIVATSRQLSAIDLDPFHQFGLDPLDFDIIVLRSKTHFRAAYEAIADRILIAETPDWGPADLSTLPYRHARAGVYPLTS